VVLGPADGLRVASAVNLDGILTIPKSALKRRLGELSAEKILDLNRAIIFALALA
jgi:mRNA-degrading endonuclease toxin of MazEF toxin-antitoxin module